VNDPVLICCEDDTNPLGVLFNPDHSEVSEYEAVVANDDVVANEALPIWVREDPSPSNEPVKRPCREDPLSCTDDDIVPVGMITLIEAVLDMTVADTLSPKSRRPAFPWVAELSAISIPTPLAINPVSCEPSPTKAPSNEPVNDPVLICVELETNPTGLLVIEFHSVSTLDANEAVSAYDEDIDASEDDAQDDDMEYDAL
jgi:hypothetical protein